MVSTLSSVNIHASRGPNQVPSLLDRILAESTTGHSSLEISDKPMKALRAALRRDIGAILNSPRRCRSISATFPNVATSLLQFGIPDLVSVWSDATIDPAAYCKELEGVILKLDPRLLELSVTIDAEKPGANRSLRILIDAKAAAGPVPERVQFDGEMDSTTQRFLLKDRPFD